MRRCNCEYSEVCDGCDMVLGEITFKIPFKENNSLCLKKQHIDNNIDKFLEESLEDKF